jgi:actin-related protein
MPEPGQVFVGADALGKRGTLKFSWPVVGGVITDWDYVSRIWSYCFTALKADPQTCNVLMVEPPGNPSANREKIVQILFDEFSVAGCYLADSARLGLRTAGLTSGLVIECGDGITRVVPVLDGSILTEALTAGLLQILDPAGGDVLGWIGAEAQVAVISVALCLKSQEL